MSKIACRLSSSTDSVWHGQSCDPVRGEPTPGDPAPRWGDSASPAWETNSPYVFATESPAPPEAGWRRTSQCPRSGDLLSPPPSLLPGRLGTRAGDGEMGASAELKYRKKTKTEESRFPPSLCVILGSHPAHPDGWLLSFLRTLVRTGLWFRFCKYSAFPNTHNAAE